MVAVKPSRCEKLLNHVRKLAEEKKNTEAQRTQRICCQLLCDVCASVFQFPNCVSGLDFCGCVLARSRVLDESKC